MLHVTDCLCCVKMQQFYQELTKTLNQSGSRGT